jgi:hypothetical protein
MKSATATARIEAHSGKQKKYWWLIQSAAPGAKSDILV